MPGPFKPWCHYHDQDPAECGGRHREDENGNVVNFDEESP